MTICRHLESGLWKIIAYRRDHLERWIKKHNFEKYHFQILHKHGKYFLYIGRANMGGLK